MKKILLILLGGAAVSLLSSCMSMRNHESWSNPEFSGRKLSKTLVMAIGDSEFRINYFESLFVEELQSQGIEAASVHALCPTVDKMDKEQIIEWVETRNFSSVFVTRILSEQDRQQMVASGYSTSPSLGYWGYGMSYSIDPEFVHVSNSMEYELETNLYEVQSRQLVWSARDVVYDNKADTANIEKLIRRLMRSIKREKML